jgi:hypothetical protein
MEYDNNHFIITSRAHSLQADPYQLSFPRLLVVVQPNGPIRKLGAQLWGTMRPHMPNSCGSGPDV